MLTKVTGSDDQKKKKKKDEPRTVVGIVIVIELMIPPRTHLYLYIVVNVHVRVSTEYRLLLNPLSLRFSLLVLSIFFSPSPVCSSIRLSVPWYTFLLVAAAVTS